MIIGTRGAPDAASPAARPPQAKVLRGTPVSTGHAEGVARVITDPHHAELLPGEILVARYTDPGDVGVLRVSKAGELEVAEMLPGPDDFLWQEADAEGNRRESGRRSFELRTQIVPRT